MSAGKRETALALFALFALLALFESGWCGLLLLCCDSMHLAWFPSSPPLCPPWKGNVESRAYHRYPYYGTRPEYV
eukprot:1147529-Prymnesium_polylepis.1